MEISNLLFYEFLSFVLFALFFSTPPNEILMQLPNLNKKFY